MLYLITVDTTATPYNKIVYAPGVHILDAEPFETAVHQSTEDQSRADNVLVVVSDDRRSFSLGWSQTSPHVSSSLRNDATTRIAYGHDAMCNPANVLWSNS